jgi:type IV secretory pathway VirB10-like protein
VGTPKAREKERTMNEPIQEKTTTPPGLLPKHVQSWLILGLAVLMVVIMWLTGGKKQASLPKANASTIQTPLPLEVNETKITDLQNRIQELQREQLAAQSALVQQNRLLGAAPDPQQTQANNASGNPSSTEDPIQTERKRRQYVSLFSSNIALSYRKTAQGEQSPLSDPASRNADAVRPSPPPTGPDLAQLAQVAQILKDAQPNIATQGPMTGQSNSATSAQTGHLSVSTSPADVKTEGKEATTPAAAIQKSSDAAAGKTYILFEGTVLESVLINRLDGQFVGPVECLLSNDVYSHDRQHLLIPAGTKILGETRRVEAFGQTRLAVAFHRLIMPDGYSLNLDQFKGLNQIGDAGLRDQVNNHYLRIFGASLAIGALGAVAEAGTGGTFNASGADLMRQGFAQSMAQSSEQILDKFLNILPTVTIREGHRVKVYLSGDLAMPDYNNHQIPPDL